VCVCVSTEICLEKIILLPIAIRREKSSPSKLIVYRSEFHVEPDNFVLAIKERFFSRELSFFVQHEKFTFSLVTNGLEKRLSATGLTASSLLYFKGISQSSLQNQSSKFTESFSTFLQH